MLQDYWFSLTEKTKKWLKQGRSLSIQPMGDVHLSPEATVIIGKSTDCVKHTIPFFHDSEETIRTMRESNDRVKHLLELYLTPPFGPPPGSLSLSVREQRARSPALQQENDHIESELVPSEPARGAQADASWVPLVPPVPIQQQAKSASASETDYYIKANSFPSLRRETVFHDYGSLELLLHDLPWEMLSPQEEKDEEARYVSRTVKLNCSHKLFNMVLGVRGQRLRKMQQHSGVRITPDIYRQSFTLIGHPTSIQLVKNFVDVISLRSRAGGKPYIIVKLAGPSVRRNLDSLSSTFGSLATVVQEHKIHFTVTRLIGGPTVMDMRKAYDVIRSVLPRVRRLASSVVMSEIAFKNPIAAKNLLAVRPSKGSKLHKIYELIHEELTRAGICHRHDTSLHVTILTKYGERNTMEVETLSELMKRINAEDILGPVTPIAIQISQHRTRECFGSEIHVPWGSISI